MNSIVEHCLLRGAISLDLHRRIRNMPEPTQQDLEFWSALPERTMPSEQDVENFLDVIRDISPATKRSKVPSI